MVTVSTVYLEHGQDEEWRNKLARELNTILARAQYVSETMPKEVGVLNIESASVDKDFVAAALSVVARVAEFEEIEEGVRIAGAIVKS